MNNSTGQPSSYTRFFTLHILNLAQLAMIYLLTFFKHPKLKRNLFYDHPISEYIHGIIFLQADNYPSNLEVTISENDFATVVSNGLMFEKLLFPPLMSLRSNI